MSSRGGWEVVVHFPLLHRMLRFDLKLQRGGSLSLLLTDPALSLRQFLGVSRGM